MSVDLTYYSNTFKGCNNNNNKTFVNKNSYYTITENVQSLTNGVGECWKDANIVKNSTGNYSDTWVRLLDKLQEGDRFVFFTVFWLFPDDVINAIINAIKRDVLCITIMTVETEYKGTGSIGMGNEWQTKQRNSFLQARGKKGTKGIIFPFHNMSFSHILGGQIYPWIYNGAPQYGNILHGKMLIWDRKSYPAVYIGSQNPEWDDEDMGITIENCPYEFLQDALSLINKFMYASILQQSSKFSNNKAPAIDNSTSPNNYFVGYINYSGITYLPGNPNSNQIINGSSWKNIEDNILSIITNIQAKSDDNLDTLNFSLDPSLFTNFPLVTKFNDKNKLSFNLADWSNYQNYQCYRQDISFAWVNSNAKNSIYYGSNNTADVYFVSGPAQFCLSDSGCTYNLTAISQIINCATTNLDIANMNPDLYNFQLFDWIMDAITRGIHVRIIIGQGQSGQNSLEQIANSVSSKTGVKGTLAIRIWDKERKFSCYSRANNSSVYHCKYIISDKSIYFGNQNLTPQFFGSMGGVGLIVDNSGPLRDQFQNYFSRDWESPFVTDFLDYWIAGDKATNLDPCFKYGTIQTRNDIVNVPKQCSNRIQPWSSNSFYKDENGNYLGHCSEISSKTNCCLPNKILSNMQSNCELDNVVSPTFTKTMCQPMNSLNKECDQTLSYRVCISIPEPQYKGDIADVFQPNSHDKYNPPDGRPISGYWTETYSAWIAATNKAQTSIDCVFIYSNLMHDKQSTAYGFYLALLNAIERGIHVRLIFCYPPNAYWTESADEIRNLKYKQPGWVPRDNVELYQNSYEVFMGSDHTKLDFVDPFKGPSSGILHTKLYIWDEQEAYVGAQNQEVTIAVESGIMLSGNNCIINDLKKVVDYYVQSSCMQCRGATVDAMLSLKDTDDMKKLKSNYNKENPLRVNLHNIGNTPYKEQYTLSDVYISATPLNSANTLNRTFDLIAINDVISRAKSDVYIAAMDLSDLTDFYTYFTYSFNSVTTTKVKNAKFSSMYDAIINAAKNGINIKIMVGLRREFGNNNPQPCGYNPENIASIMKLCNDINSTSTGSLHAKFIKFDCKAKDFCYGIFHTKFIVTDQSVLIDTSNLTGDYFISTAGVSFVCHSAKDDQVLALNNDMLNFYKKFWESKLALNVEDVICNCNTDFNCINRKVKILKPETLSIDKCIGSKSTIKNNICVPITAPSPPSPPSPPSHSRHNNKWLFIIIIIIIVLIIAGGILYLKKRK